MDWSSDDVVYSMFMLLLLVILLNITPHGTSKEKHKKSAVQAKSDVF